ncbi:protein-glutamate O-methyltransferase CheR [Paenibacillus sp.]|uniref:CheR family methyltransferase n=1 Tax=Paenibacillus sp. TaxID=58172 RepID=UPI002D6BFACF|nr:protein-glutamate O-methyltransferase CheR [Paenibacillus sp.]HZG56744.1 protein-glutamate O-methyltransferase CheR [Paenibacillus sp.]
MSGLRPNGPSADLQATSRGEDGSGARRPESAAVPEDREQQTERVEIELLLEGIFRIYGYDFRHYALGSICRRAKVRMQAEGLPTLSALQALVLRDAGAMRRLLQDFSIPVTEMFRDPAYFLALRERVLPELASLPSFRIWHAGCSTGEEAYSMAIMLREEGLEGRATIYATDMNERLLETARGGRYPIARMKQYTSNYLRAGGRQPFSEYYSVSGDEACFDPTLRKHIVFARHNLATDHSFNEFQLILCRNVLIYFNPALQKRVLRLFRDSLPSGGILGLGVKEAVLNTLEWSELDQSLRLYRAL